MVEPVEFSVNSKRSSKIYKKTLNFRCVFMEIAFFRRGMGNY